MGELIRPGRPAGFDRSHPAAANIRFSAVAQNANFVNILSGKLGTPSVTPPTALITPFGQATAFVSASSERLNFPGQPATFDAFATIAGVYVPTAFTSDRAAILNTSSNGSAGYALSITTGAKLAFYLQGIGNTVVWSSGPTLQTGVPYFILGTLDNTAKLAWFAIANLLTGAATVTSSGVAGIVVPSSASSNGTYQIGENADAGSFLDGQVMAVMYAATLLSPAVMGAWAADPWGFWYPRTQNIAPRFGLSAVIAGFSPWWANNNNSPVLGTGTY